jgi:internalin A
MRLKATVTNLRAWWETLSPTWQDILSEQVGQPDRHGVPDLLALTQCTELDASRVKLTHLGPLRMLPQLQVLDLSYTALSSLQGLSYCENLRELHLINLPDLDLAEVACLKRLELLDISFPERFDPFNLALLEELPHLQELYCNHCGVDNVVPFLSMETLRVLSVNFNPIPREEVRALRDLLPKCRILA